MSNAGKYTANQHTGSPQDQLLTKKHVEIMLLLKDTLPSRNLVPSEQLEALQKIFSQQTSTQSTIETGSLAHKSNYSSALTVNSKNSSWIVDSGASNHMMGDASIFYHYNPCQEVSQ